MFNVRTFDTVVEMKEASRRFDLVKYGARLWTRERARKIRSDLTPYLDDLSPGELLIIDLDEVEVFDYSFANELFGRTLMSLPREYPGRFLAVEHLSEYVRENLTQALLSLDLTMLEVKGDALHLIGKVHAVDRETFEAIVGADEPATAAELGERLEVSQTAMNERLTKLYERALIHRDKGVSPAGRELYVYRSPV